MAYHGCESVVRFFYAATYYFQFLLFFFKKRKNFPNMLRAL